jgi:septal ring factor EnvC (AmiA/AmiB activator)
MYQTSDLTQHSEELQQSTTDDDEDITLHMKLALKSDKCDELQRDLAKFAQAFWEQSEEMDQCQRQIKKLETENKELRCLKWIENEVDAMWLEVKKMDKAKSERRDQLEALLTERQELLDTVVDKSNEINRLKAKLANSPVPGWVQTRIDEIQEDLS